MNRCLNCGGPISGDAPMCHECRIAECREACGVFAKHYSDCLTEGDQEAADRWHELMVAEHRRLWRLEGGES